MDTLLLLRATFPTMAYSMDSRANTVIERANISSRNSFSHLQYTTTLLKVSFKKKYPMHLRSSGEGKTGVFATFANEEEAEDVSPSKRQSDELTQSVLLLKTAAKTRKVSASEICAALRVIEDQKIDPSDFPSIIGGSRSPGRTWMLVFTANKDQSKGGTYFPVTAIQSFDTQTSKIANGVYLGPLGAFILIGTYSWVNRRVPFYFHSLSLKVGPLGPFTFKIASTDKTIGKDDAFFIWYYADDEVIVARGRAGGTAYWVRCTNVQKASK